jgi:hypothetical protein
MTASGDLALWTGDAGDLAGWTSSAAPGSSAQLSVDGAALRLDFSLSGHGNWVIARRERVATLPAHYVGVLEVRGTGSGPLELQVKLVDPSGANVWWWRRRGFTPGPNIDRLVLRKAGLEFAWGPVSGGAPECVGAVEVALAGGERSTTGTLWIEALRIEARDPASAQPSVHAVRASSAAPGHPAAHALAAGDDTTWRPAGGDARPWLELDLGRISEWGGTVVDFAAAAAPCRLLASDDGERWTPLAEAPGGEGRRRWLRTTEGEGRLARLEFAPASTPEVAHADVVPLELAVSPARCVAALASRAPRGRFPRHLLGEQAYWAVVGADGDERKGLLSEDGALEVDAESFTLEPFLWLDGRLSSWADVDGQLSLAHDHLPVPSVEWQAADVRLRITAVSAGPPGQSVLIARYAIENTGRAPRAVRLFVAVRPFQVNPAWQSLNLVGGVAPIEHLECDGATVVVNAARRVVAVTRPDAVGGAPTGQGLDALADGRVPPSASVDDPLGFAEGAFAFDVALDAGEMATVGVAVPLHDTTPTVPAGLDRAAAATWLDQRLTDTLAGWRARLTRVPIELPRGAARTAATLRASLAWILVNREGPRIQPGPRCYRRSWIRDGTLTGTALAEMGFADEARAFLRWYAPFQLPDGRVPCAVDRRGVDPAVEHDSHGQLVWGVVETFRLTGDRDFLYELWPHLLRAVEAIRRLRAERTTAAHRGTARFGLLPESISHEGYASRPVHSYWDDFFAVRALADAADAAAVLGDAAAEQSIAALRDAMRADLHASIARTMRDHGIDFIPGSVELGDFDPTSTAIALDPCGETARLPGAALARTFDRYWAEFEARRRGETPADAYTPYEVRTAAALVLLGQKERAAALLDWLVADQRPPPWCQWPEVAWREPRAPRFLGDLPHGWVASSFVRAVRRMVAYERADDGALVLAAGVPEAWVREAPGVRVGALPTHFGPLDYTMCAEGADRIRVVLGGGIGVPPGGIVIMSPFARPLRGALIDARQHAVAGAQQVVLRDLAAEVILIY